MKKTLLSIVAIGMIAGTSLFAKNVPTDQLPNVPQLKQFGMKVVGAEDDGLDIIKIYALDDRNPTSIRGTTGYLTKKDGVFFLGQNMIMKDKNGQVPFKLTKDDIKQMIAEESFTIGNGKNEFILFTDPQCPYCQKFEKEMPNLKDDVKLHVFLYPLSFHNNAVKMSSWILSAPKEKRAERLSAIANGNTDYMKYDGELKTKEIKQNILNGLKIGVQGTPSVFSIDGTPLRIQDFIMDNIKQPAPDALPDNVISFLNSQEIPILLNKEVQSDDAIYLFLDPMDKGGKDLLKSDLVQKNIDKKKVYVILIPKSLDSFLNVLDVNIQKDKHKQLTKLNNYLNGKKMSTQRMKDIDAAIKDGRFKQDIGKIKLVGNINKQFNIQDFPFATDKNGKFIKAK